MRSKSATEAITRAVGLGVPIITLIVLVVSLFTLFLQVSPLYVLLLFVYYRSLLGLLIIVANLVSFILIATTMTATTLGKPPQTWATWATLAFSGIVFVSHLSFFLSISSLG
jgi:hypothetical protein